MKKQVPPVGAQAKSDSARPADPIQRILVVDDDSFFCHRNAEVLIRHGYEVNAAEDGAAGWKELQANRYNLLITENELPSLTGLQLVKKLRSARMALPVILSTEKKLPAPAVRLLRLQPVITLLKPYTIAEFIGAVRVVLGAPDADGERLAPPNWQGYLPADGVWP